MEGDNFKFEITKTVGNLAVTNLVKKNITAKLPTNLSVGKLF